jgi:hypothetical protein
VAVYNLNVTVADNLPAGLQAKPASAAADAAGAAAAAGPADGKIQGYCFSRL